MGQRGVLFKTLSTEQHSYLRDGYDCAASLSNTACVLEKLETKYGTLYVNKIDSKCFIPSPAKQQYKWLINTKTEPTTKENFKPRTTIACLKNTVKNRFIAISLSIWVSCFCRYLIHAHKIFTKDTILILNWTKTDTLYKNKYCINI